MESSKWGEVTNTGRCRSCQAPVVWVVTPKGAKMPVDPDTDESHFSTCPEAAQHRKPRQKKLFEEGESR